MIKCCTLVIFPLLRAQKHLLHTPILTIITDHPSHYKSPHPSSTKYFNKQQINQSNMKGSMATAMLAMMVMALVMVRPTEAITCGDLSSMLSPCLGYLQQGGSPTSACCDGVRRLQGATRSQADRRTACTCAKNAARQIRVRQDAANSLAGKCGVSTSVQISPNVNCGNIP